jgi:hypothetical protein
MAAVSYFISQPAVKILDFFRAFIAGETREDVETTGTILSMNKMQALSPTIHTLQPIGSEDAKAWVRYWSSKGLF